MANDLDKRIARARYALGVSVTCGNSEWIHDARAALDALLSPDRRTT